MHNYIVSWQDAGNCDIASVNIQARSVHEAIVLSYHALNAKQFAEVQQDAVGIFATKEAA